MLVHKAYKFRIYPRLEQTDHYQIMNQFFTDKDRLLHHLFN
ncbi:hypothetical protein P4U44_10805 [Alkalihalobacillus alcalophilus]|nr:hypothetical protein [Alkalihalobacillus alcalophilus]MED1562384.1 hypothetical protein [Alkalihalobacillus alcalophilus]